MENPQIFWDKLEQTVAKIWPELPKYIEHKEYYGTADVSALTREHVLPGQGGECIGLGQIVGQCGRHKPSAKAPLQGLFYVGCDAGGYGCGTHHGVDSGFRVAHMVLQYHQMHQGAF
jgi:prolycopene isomerase